MKKFLAVILSAALSIALLTAAAPRTAAVKTSAVKKAAVKSAMTVSRYKTYAQLCAAVKKAQTRDSGYSGTYFGAKNAMALEDAAAAPTASASQTSASASAAADSDYSRTNVQVAGVDEGDIMKIDGKYIYVIHDDDLIVFKADGAATKQVARIAVTDGNNGQYPSELYVSGDRLAVIMGSYSICYAVEDKAAAAAATSDCFLPGYPSESKTSVALYDITDPEAPKVMTSLGQDGSVLTSRLLNGKLYVVSNYWVYSDVNASNPGSFVPQLYRGGAPYSIPCEKITGVPVPESPSYVVICAYDLEKDVISDTSSVLGGGDTVYMNSDRLYLIHSDYSDVESARRTEGVYSVVDHRCFNSTTITRIGLSPLSVQSAGKVPGSVGGSYYVDEQNGYTRIATTNYTYSYSIYSDAKQGFDNYKGGDDNTTANALYVLDSGMNVVGKAENIAPGENLYSVRYDGNYAYLCTFRQIDPLFVYDLSNPGAPKKLSELKLPGFSEYLHVWADGRLFGLGQSATDEGRVTGMKMVMFDISDKANVTAASSLELGEGYSEALYNPHAILIDYARNLIGFPTDGGYALYSYTDVGGFAKLTSIKGADWDYNMRGAYIGNYLYIVGSSGVTVIDLGSFQTVGNVNIAD